MIPVLARFVRIAVKHRHTEMVKWLLCARPDWVGIDPMFCTSEQKMPLYHAAWRGYSDVVALLIAHPGTRTNPHTAPHMHACMRILVLLAYCASLLYSILLLTHVIAFLQGVHCA